ncbi:MAG: hypothetical protein RR139_08315 [Lachnospiraceae bacterium]
MNISGIRPYTGLYNYNVTKSAEEQSVSAQQIERQQEKIISPIGSKEIIEEKKRSQTDTGDYAKQYKPLETYELKGKDSSLESLDMERAISDMQKDQLLHQYQFFVGTSRQSQSLEQPLKEPLYQNFNI